MLKWLEVHTLPCAYKTIFGFDCPLCGSQRALILLLKGECKHSFLMYPPLLPVLALILFFLLQRLFRMSIPLSYLYRFSVVVLAIVACNYSVKIFMH